MTGQDFGAARDYLNDAGLRQTWSGSVMCRPNFRRPPLGKVYSMDPAAGSVVNKASIITLHYYGPPCNP